MLILYLYQKRRSLSFAAGRSLTSFLHSECRLTQPAPIPPPRSLEINSDWGSQREMAPVHIDRPGDERIGDRGRPEMD